jgi:hypothetical protein
VKQAARLTATVKPNITGYQIWYDTSYWDQPFTPWSHQREDLLYPMGAIMPILYTLMNRLRICNRFIVFFGSQRVSETAYLFTILRNSAITYMQIWRVSVPTNFMSHHTRTFYESSYPHISRVIVPVYFMSQRTRRFHGSAYPQISVLRSYSFQQFEFGVSQVSST